MNLKSRLRFKGGLTAQSECTDTTDPKLPLCCPVPCLFPVSSLASKIPWPPVCILYPGLVPGLKGEFKQ